MARSPQGGLGAAALVVMVLAMAATAHGGEVMSLNDDMVLNSTASGGGLSNATAAAPAEIKEPEEKKPATQEEAELESYKVKVREIIKEEGGDPTDGEVTKRASQLMQLDKAKKSTGRMREIAKILRDTGPEETRVEVDPKHFELEAEERQKRAVAKQEEENRQKMQKQEMDHARKHEATIVKQMLDKYTQETMDPALEKQIQAAHKAFNKASSTENKLRIPADGPDPYGVHDKSSWAAPEKNDAKAKGSNPTAEAEKGTEQAEESTAPSDDSSGSSK